MDESPKWVWVPFTTKKVYITPLGRFFEARLLDNQEGANTERYIFGTLSARCFLSAPFFFWHRDYIPTAVEISSTKKRSRGV